MGWMRPISGLCCAIFAIILLGASAIDTFLPFPLHAQEQTSSDGKRTVNGSADDEKVMLAIIFERITLPDATAYFRGRVNAAAKRCEPLEIDSLARNVADFHKLVELELNERLYGDDYNINSLGSGERIPQPSLSDHDLNNLSEANDQLTSLSKILAGLIKKCSPEAIGKEVERLARNCRLDEARQLFGKLDRIAQELKARSKSLKDSRTATFAERSKAQKQADSAEEARRYAKAELDISERNCPRKVSDSSVPDEESLPPELREDQNETGNICYEPKPQLASQCNAWAPLIGRWTSPKHGGVIELSLDGNGIMSAKIVSANNVMKENGYTAGMQILRGWHFGYSNHGTWKIAALDGEYFTPAFPGRKSGEPYGDPTWSKNAVVYIEKADPSHIRLPTGLESGMGNYDKWTKMGSVSPAY